MGMHRKCTSRSNVSNKWTAKMKQCLYELLVSDLIRFPKLRRQNADAHRPTTPSTDNTKR